MRTFKGYRRSDGSIGVRNHVIVINTSGELAGFTKKIGKSVPGVIPVAHQSGEAQFIEDAEQTLRTLVGIGGHPNVSAVLFLGKEPEGNGKGIVEQLKSEGKCANYISLQTAGSIIAFLEEAKSWLEIALKESKKQKTEEADISELKIGLECGGSDAWSGITANPAIGAFSDALVSDGGTSILGETTEAVGAEHILANQAINKEVSEKFLRIVHTYEQRAKAIGEDIKSANPSPGNKAGGLTTLEEKSLGCIKKGGTSPLMEVIDYASSPSKKGFVFMDTPGYDVESVTGLVAGGAQIVLFSTGKGSPTGSPIAPVIKIGTNPRLFERMPEHIDVNAGKIIDQNYTIDQIGEEIYSTVLEVANGGKTASEKFKHQEFSIWRLAETQ